MHYEIVNGAFEHEREWSERKHLRKLYYRLLDLYWKNHTRQRKKELGILMLAYSL